MTKQLFRTISLLYLLGVVFLPHAFAYEVQTHETLSRAAALQSNLAKYLPAIGLKSLDDPLTDIGTTRSVVDWIRQGANDEDDTISLNFARYRNHFFDPQHGGAGYSYVGVDAGEPSPDWALEDTRTFFSQSYSFRNARQAFYDALTLDNKDNREQWMARTFYILGHVIHHPQDMAQPQHTRNDSHGGFFLGPKSLYEIWTKEHPDDPVLAAALAQPYGPVTFDTARKFWSTDDGKGIAQFSSDNFVSAGTNFTGTSSAIGPNPNYPKPDGTGAVVTTRPITDADLLGPNQPLTGEIDFIGTPVTDNYQTSLSGFNPRTSSYSLFDADLTIAGAEKTFTLNRFNFQAAYPFLIPRAVGYSAGLIDYFFRGKLDFIAHPSTPGAYAIENLSNEAMNGTFELHYDDMTGNRVLVPGASWTLAVPANGQSGALTFTGPTAPLPKTPGQYMLVFRGALGQETDAVVGKLVHCTLKTNEADYPPPVFTGDSSYESLPFVSLTREPDGGLLLKGLLWIKKHPIPPPVLRCFPLPGPPFCFWYLYYPPSPYFNSYDPFGDRYTPSLLSGNEFVKVWIDLNGDRSYSNDELVYEGEYSPLLVGLTWYYDQLIDIAVPLNISPQGYCETMLRVALSWGGPPPGPYGDWAYGSVYDFPVSLK